MSGFQTGTRMIENSHAGTSDIWTFHGTVSLEVYCLRSCRYRPDILWLIAPETVLSKNISWQKKGIAKWVMALFIYLNKIRKQKSRLKSKAKPCVCVCVCVFVW